MTRARWRRLARPARGRVSICGRLLPLLILSVLLLTRCAAPPGVVFAPLAVPLVWPPPPEAARIQYVGQLSSDQDLKPGVSAFDSLGQALFGKASPRAMVSPYAVTTDGRSRVFVADSNAQLVHVFDLATRAYHAWRPGDKKDSRFAQPVAVLYLPDRRLLVSDSVAGVIDVFDDSGRHLAQWGGKDLQRPCGLALQRGSNRVLVVDAAQHQILVFDLSGRLLLRTGQRGAAPGQFNYPTNIACDSADRVYVSDTLNFRVQVLAPDFKPVRTLGKQGDVPGTFSQPKGLALDSHDHLYVVDAHFEAVQVFDAEGRLLLSFGEEGHDPGRFWLPAGIHIDASNRIWIADSYNKRVQVFDYLSAPREGKP